MTTKTAPRGPYAKTAKLRARAIDAGIELFGSAGYNGATLTEVADKLGMSLTGLQHHFPDKDTLLAAVLQERDRRADTALPTGSHVDVLEALAEMLSTNQQTPGLMELQCVLSAEATSADHPAHDYFRTRYARLRAEATGVFREMAERGDLIPSVGPESLAAMLIALVDGLQLQWLLEPGSVDIEGQTRDFLRTFVPALR